MFVTAATSEAGATVNRISEKDQGDWSEWTVRSLRPIFKWRASDGAAEAQITVLDMDEEPPREVWQGAGEGSHFAYPETAPALEIGLPYQVRVRLPDGAELQALFSIDPDLDGPDTALSGVVPVR